MPPMVFVISAVMLVLGGLFDWRQQRQARHWPSINATIVERRPKSIFERDLSTYYLNLDSDFFLEYQIGGRSYAHPVAEKANFRISGIKLWRKKPDLCSVPIRYNPDQPGEFRRDDHPVWLWKLLLFLGLVSALIATYLFARS